MSAKTKTAVTAPSAAVLPLPLPVLEHHGKTLFPLMLQWGDQKRVPPVLLITGPAGVGKRSIAYYLAQWLLCENPGGKPGPCGECTPCHRALKGNWVDFNEISSDSDDDHEPAGSTKLKIEQFRKLRETAGFGAHESRFKIHLIHNADHMTPQASNSVLKIIEEPPKDWIFLLTASDPSLLLPTLVSRCQRLRLRPFPDKELLELLNLGGIPRERQALCMELAQGSWGKAVALADDETWVRRETILRFLKNPAAELNTIVDWASQGTGELGLLLDQLEQCVHDRLCKTVPTDDRVRSFLVERAERMARARQEMLAPVNKKLLAQDILLPWLEQ